MTLLWIRKTYWNFLSKISIKAAIEKDASGMVYIDQERYPSEWCVDVAWAKQVLSSKCSEYYVYRQKGKIIAYYSLIYVNLEAFMKLSYNQISEKSLTEYLMAGSGYVYIFSVNSLPNTPKHITKQLLIHMTNRINKLRNKHFKFIALAISDDGKRILRKSGLKPFYEDLPNNVVVFSDLVI